MFAAMSILTILSWKSTRNKLDEITPVFLAHDA